MEKNMKKTKTLGMSLFVLGITILILYGMYQGLQNIETIDYVILSGVVILVVGFLTLLMSIVIEQQRGKEKIKKEIKKEDLEP